MHECERVYADRLISNTEIQRCIEIIVDVAKRVIDDDQEALFKQPNAWTTFATATMDDSRAYLPIKSMASLKKVLHDQLHEYNENNAIMNLVLFDMAMLHVVRIARIIGFPQGNALLVGVGGSGKQSLARLASFICGNTVTQVAVTSTFGVNELKEELKELCAFSVLWWFHFLGWTRGHLTRSWVVSFSTLSCFGPRRGRRGGSERRRSRRWRQRDVTPPRRHRCDRTRVYGPRRDRDAPRRREACSRR